MRLDDIQLILKVADMGSMTRAARELHLTPAAVSAAVQRVEEAVGVRIFERTTRSLHPTEEGTRLIGGCEEVLARWHQTLDDVRERSLSGTVRVSAPADSTYQVLQTVLMELGRTHPDLRVLLHTSDAVQHLQRDAIDLAIRYGALKDSGLSARKLVSSLGILVASPAYLDAAGEPTEPSELRHHRCITLQLAGAPVRSWTLRAEGREEVVRVQGNLCGDGFLARRWALAGEGIAYKSMIDVIDELEAGSLRRVLPAYDLGTMAVHAVFPSRRFLPARVRAVDDALSTAFADRQRRCEEWLASRSRGVVGEG